MIGIIRVVHILAVLAALLIILILIQLPFSKTNLLLGLGMASEIIYMVVDDHMLFADGEDSKIKLMAVFAMAVMLVLLLFFVIHYTITARLSHMIENRIFYQLSVMDGLLLLGTGATAVYASLSRDYPAGVWRCCFVVFLFLYDLFLSYVVLKNRYFNIYTVTTEHIKDGILEALIVVDTDHRLRDFNEKAKEFFPELFEHGVGNKIEESIEVFENFFKEGRTRFHWKDKYYDSYTREVRFHKEFLGHMIIVTDMTEIYDNMERLIDLKQEAENAKEDILSQSQFLQNVFNTLQRGIIHYTVGSKGHVINANDAAYAIWGYTKEEFKEKFGGSFVPLIYDEDRHILEELKEKLTLDGPGITMDLRYVNADGAVRWMNTQTNQMLNEEGIEIYQTLFSDVTEQRSRQLEMQVTMDNIPCYIVRYEIREKPVLLSANERFYKFLGYDESEISDALIEDAIREKQNYRETYEVLKKGEMVSFEFQTRKKNGEEVYLQFIGNCVEWQGDIPIYLVVLVDITNLQKSQQAIEHQANFLQSSFDGMQNGIIQMDMKNHMQVISMNQAISNAIGVEIREFDETTNDKLINCVHEEDRVKLIRHVREIIRNRKNQQFELRVVRNDGQIIWFNVHMRCLFNQDGWD